jgi:3-oxoacyl-[acyl-carrier-protein] synthase II
LLPFRAGVVIVGVGVVTASGTSVAGFFEDLLGGRRPFVAREIPLVATGFPAGPGRGGVGVVDRPVFAAHVEGPLDLTAVVGARAARVMGRDSCLLVYAMHTTGVCLAPYADRTGVVVGTLRAGRNEYLAIHNATGSGGGPVNPVWGPQSGYNAPAAQLSIHIPARGPNLTLSCGATAGLEAVVVGAEQITEGICEAVVAGGLDTLSPEVAAAGPSGAVRGPYDTGFGVVPDGEAAAVLVLRAAGAGPGRVLAGLLGSGRATVLPADSDGEARGALAQAAEEALRGALREAGRVPAEVGFAVTASGGDRAVEYAETTALAGVFGTRLPVCNATGTTGRTGGADGALAVVVAVEALGRGVLPPAAGAPVPASAGRAGDRLVAPAGPLAVCLGVDRGGSATAVLVGPADVIREETA